MTGHRQSLPVQGATYYRVAQQLIAEFGLIRHFDPQLHARDGRLEIVRNGRQNLRAFTQIGLYPRLHLIKSVRCGAPQPDLVQSSENGPQDRGNQPRA